MLQLVSSIACWHAGRTVTHRWWWHWQRRS